MEQYETYADYVAAMEAAGTTPVSAEEFMKNKNKTINPPDFSSNILNTENKPLTPTLIDPNTAGTNIDADGKTVSSLAPLVANTADPTGLDVSVPTAPEGLGQLADIQKVDTGFGQAQAATLDQPSYMIGDIQGTLSEGALAKAQTEELDRKGTVQYQLSELMASIEEGKPMPPWASPAVRKVAGIMNARGMGASSMGSAAMIQAVMESGVPIAAADAQAYQRIQLQNLSNKQATALKNAATVASMDMANLNARMTAAVHNARNFLTLDTKNLDNQQKSNMLTYQSLVQAAFTDAAQENARRQFNAKNELQVEEFYDELGSQIESANANREASMRQFNISQENAINQFNTQMRDSRDKFNSNMKFAIDQSNVTWRRDVNTANTAVQNETNRINVQNQFNAEQAALNMLWQNYRDNASFNFQKTENMLNRKHQTGMAALEFSNNQDLLNQQEKGDLMELLGTWVISWARSS